MPCRPESSNAIYPEWWPKDDEIEEDEPQIDDEQKEKEKEELESKVVSESAYPDQPQVQHPQIYNQPIAFSVPKQNFAKDAGDNNIVQFHVNLYPEYMQKCLDPNASTKIKTADDEPNELSANINKQNQSECQRAKPKKAKQSRTRSLTRCTESSQAKAKGVRPQSAYLRSVNRDIAPCLKRKKQPNPTKSIKKKRKKKVKGSKPKYLQNVQSRIKNDLMRDKMRKYRMQNETEDLMQNIAKYGLDDNENDEYYDEWREQFGYNRIGRDEINKPSAISVADAMMQSEIIQGIDPSLNKRPTLITGNLTDFDDNDTNILYEDMPKREENAYEDANESLSMNMNFLTDLREWASGLVDNIEHDTD